MSPKPMMNEAILDPRIVHEASMNKPPTMEEPMYPVTPESQHALAPAMCGAETHRRIG